MRITVDSSSDSMTTSLVAEASSLSHRIIAGWQAVSVDIETNPSDGDRIFKLGAVRSDNERELSLPTGRLAADEVAGGR